MNRSMEGWKARDRPERVTLEGRYCRLEPLDAAAHGPALFEAVSDAAAAERMRYLPDHPSSSMEAFSLWLDQAQASPDPLFFAVVDKTDGRAKGRQSLMRIDPANGVIEIGHIYWGPAMARSRLATEALHLHAQYVFDTLGYRRLEWKCNDRNTPSRRAARRFGFDYEGVFRQHMVVKGENRDTAWYAMLDGDWLRMRDGYEAWLDPRNFDGDGRQIARLQELTAAQDAR